MKRKYRPEEVQQHMSGRIYINAEDLNIFVRRKSPYSWTMNLGNKWSWIIIGGELLLIMFLCFLLL